MERTRTPTTFMANCLWTLPQKTIRNYYRFVDIAKKMAKRHAKVAELFIIATMIAKKETITSIQRSYANFSNSEKMTTNGKKSNKTRKNKLSLST